MSVSLMYRIKRFIWFLSLLNVEPTLFVMMFFWLLMKTPTDQLIQDKFCLQKYHAPTDYCAELPRMTPEDDYLHIKSSILEDVTQFNQYSTYITTIPSLVTALFIGSWCDNYVHAKKVLLSASAIAGILTAFSSVVNVYFFDISQNYILFNNIPAILSGGGLAAMTAVFAYVTSTTPVKLRSLRMFVGELVIFAAIPLGTYIGGKVLNTRPIFSEKGQLHNYALVFIIGGVAHLTSLVWIVFRVNEKRDIETFNRFSREENMEMESKVEMETEKKRQWEDNEHIHPLKLLFNWHNVVDMCKTCFKRRDNLLRAQIWLIFLSMLCYLMVHMGPNVFLYPFVQKVYEWNSETYSNASSIGSVITALVTLIAVPILIKKLKAKDTTLAIIGLVSYFIQNMIRGLVLSPHGYYIGILVGSLGSLTSIGIKTHISKIVERQELGKIFCFMSAMDSMAPGLSSLIFTFIFDATMDSMPGISFIIVGGILVPPVIIMIWIDLYTKQNQHLDDYEVRDEEKAVDNQKV